MLEAITDFWKPAKKGQTEEKLEPKQLQVGSAIGFGFVPQSILSGRRLAVSAINTYQFGEESLTSFILTQEKDPGVSMIIAESEGERYLALSRRVSTGDRMKLFTAADFDAVLTSSEVTKLPCKDNVADYKGWTVTSYRREIQGLKGRIFKGDFRDRPLPPVKEAQEFEYTLLVSESNEHAIEVEKYSDGRVEVYATVYRRMNDVGEITHPKEAAKEKEMGRPDIKLASEPEKKPAPAMSQPAEPVKPSPMKFQELPAPVALREEPKTPAKNQPEPQKATPAASAPAPEQKTPATTNSTQPTNNGATKTMSTNLETNMKPKLYVQPTTEAYAKEIKTVTNGATTFDSEAIECDLRVANKIIDEAIRNEMRLTDIVRRIIELPVANQESVQIPVTLTDEDYSLLAIRYGISSNDRGAIKRRIIEDLNDFSGSTAATKKAA